MFKTVLSLQWKEFNRGKSVGGKLVAKIFKWFWLIYFAFMSVMIGIIASAYGGPLMEFPLENNSLAPFEYVNGQLIYFFAYLIVMRYFIQSLPVLNIRSFLLTSILKKDIVRFSLLKTILTYFNVLPLFFLVPFTLILASSGNYDTLGLVGWNINLLGIIYLTNFFNFLLNNKNNLIYIVGTALGLIKALEYFSIIDFTIYSKEAFYLFYDIPYLSLFTWLFVFWLYSYVKKYFVTGLYIDTGLQVKIKEAKMDDFSWLDRFGKTATFMPKPGFDDKGTGMAGLQAELVHIVRVPGIDGALNILDDVDAVDRADGAHHHDAREGQEQVRQRRRAQGRVAARPDADDAGAQRGPRAHHRGVEVHLQVLPEPLAAHRRGEDEHARRNEQGEGAGRA